MAFNRAQRAVLALGLLVVVAMASWVPYAATYRWKQQQLTVDAGYQTILTPPSGRICLQSVSEYTRFYVHRLDEERCQIAIDFKRLGLTVAAALLGMAALILLLGLLRPSAATPDG